MTFEERVEINNRIDLMIGSREQQRTRVADWELKDKINSNNHYNKMREHLFKIAEKEGVEALTLTLITYGRTNEGVTAKGKKFVWEGNNGFTERSRYCGSLYIQGIGTVFTSGTIAKAVEYIINN